MAVCLPGTLERHSRSYEFMASTVIFNPKPRSWSKVLCKWTWALNSKRNTWICWLHTESLSSQHDPMYLASQSIWSMVYWPQLYDIWSIKPSSLLVHGCPGMNGSCPHTAFLKRSVRTWVLSYLNGFIPIQMVHLLPHLLLLTMVQSFYVIPIVIWRRNSQPTCLLSLCT